MRALGYFTFRDLMHDRWRSLLTIFSLAVVVIGYLLLSSLAQAFVIFVKQSRITSNLVVIAADTIDPKDSSLNEEVLQTAREIAPNEIQRTFPTLFQHLTIGGHIIQIRAVPLEEMPNAMALTLVEGNWPAGSQQVVVSEDIAQVNSWKVGSSINIYGTDFQVTGLVRTVENNYGAVWMTYTEGQLLFGTAHGFQIGYLSLEPWANPESVRTILMADRRFSANNVAYLESTLNDGYNQINTNLLTMSSILALVYLLAVTFGIYNVTSLSLTERGREISLLRVLGFSQGRLRGYLFVRALVLTLVAYGLGWMISLVFINYQRLHTSIDLFFAPLILRLTPSTSLLGLGLVTVFAILGVLLTTGRFASQNPLSGSD